MKLFLCSHFSSVGSLIKEEIENKKVAFITTASLREGYTAAGFSREITVIDYGFTTDTEKFVTEIMIPLQKV